MTGDEGERPKVADDEPSPVVVVGVQVLALILFFGYAVWSIYREVEPNNIVLAGLLAFGGVLRPATFVELGRKLGGK